MSTSNVLNEIRRFYPEYHPLVSIAKLAHSTEDERLEFDCHRVIAKYVEPELKSLEVRGVFENTRRVSVSLFDDTDVVDAEILQQNQQALIQNTVDAVVNGY